MPNEAGRVTEAEVAAAVLRALEKQPNGEASIGELTREVPKFLELGAEDQMQSETRPGEELWEQQVRNIIGHRETPGNAISDGLIEYSPNHLKLTDAGRQYLRSKG